MSNQINLSALSFPKRLQCTEIKTNTTTFQKGFEEKYVQGGLQSSRFVCSICHGVPRFPWSIDRCEHIFCEDCLYRHYDGATDFKKWYGANKCPVCVNTYNQGTVKVFCRMDKETQALFQSIQIRCPFECGQLGSPLEIDEHQVYSCPNRTIVCPNLGCKQSGPAKDISEQHFPHCEKLRVYCYRCQLPVPVQVLNTHNCKRRQKDAVRSMFVCFNVIFMSPLKYIMITASGLIKS
jgi:hypothetical protein